MFFTLNLFRTPFSLLLSLSSLDLVLNSTGHAPVALDDVFINATDNCESVDVSLNTTLFTCASVGTNTLLITALDVAGNQDTDVVTVTVADNSPPALDALSAITLQLDTNGEVDVLPTDVINTDSDNCAVTSRTLAQSHFTCAHVGSQDVLLTIADAQDNQAQANISVLVQDSVNPLLTTAPYLQLTLDATHGNASIDADDTTLSTSDNCQVNNQTLSQASFQCAHLGNNTITTTTYDVNGNSNASTTVVEVVDAHVPNLVVRPTLTLELDAAGLGVIDADNLTTSVTDNCAVAAHTINQTAFACADVGATIPVLVSAQDTSEVQPSRARGIPIILLRLKD